MTQATGVKARQSPGTAPTEEGVLVRMAIGFTTWAERWFPDAFIFVAIAVVVVSLAALANGAVPLVISRAFGDGFWGLIPFTMQMAFVVIGGYVVASSAPAQKLIRRGPAPALSASWRPWPCCHRCSTGA
jgi:short-chain fatty acids transporter